MFRTMTTRISRNYLRVRGEYGAYSTGTSGCLELPPRARRIHQYQEWGRYLDGTTSACAENTEYPRVVVGVNRNYLRVRGEYPK